ncbi:MAG: glycoside hydrolase family 15 protein [Nocardioidaceae bacterium]
MLDGGCAAAISGAHYSGRINLDDAADPISRNPDRDELIASPGATTTGIGDLAFLSDCRSAAFVSRQGSVDWWCAPRLDSPSVLGRLLDPGAGHWELCPVEPSTCERSYADGGLVLLTRYVTASGEALVRDALALEPGARGHDLGRRSPGILVREVRGITGSVAFATELVPRFEYGLTAARARLEGTTVVMAAGPVTLRFEASCPVECDETSVGARFTVSEGDTVGLRLAAQPSYHAVAPVDADAAALLDDTTEGWSSWSSQHKGIEGPHRDLVARSAIVLQGLTYAPSGAVAAAATTALPEEIGADRNWDYRYAWLRDISITMRALWIAACPDEADRFFSWIASAVGRLGDSSVQIMFGVEGERDLTERELDHLSGFRDSTPVRVGNDAWDQRQLDVPGEVLDAAHQLREQLEFDEQTAELLVSLAERAYDDWQQPDAGMWEARDSERHYVSSKVFCWVALDRAIRLAPLLGTSADAGTVQRWATGRDEIRHVVLERAWSDKAGAYTGALDSDELDASVLVLPLVGFVEADEPRMLATIDVIESKLGRDGTVRRWDAEPAGFFLCSFWLVECLALAGRRDRAARWFDRTLSFSGELGLLAEQMDAATGEQLGNIPSGVLPR